MDQPLKNKVALVTGAGSGIGRAAVLEMTRQGAKVVAVDHNLAAAQGTAALAGDGSVLALSADVTDPDQMAAAVSAAVENYGKLNVAFNNAGIGGIAGSTAELEVSDWRHVIEVNLIGVFNSMKAEIPAMLDGDGGSIINTASGAGVVGLPSMSAYSASKHGVLGLTKTAGLEYARQGIRINAVLPGVTRTPAVAALSEELRDSMADATPIGRIAEPEEIARVVAWLASDACTFAVGASFTIDGGHSII